MIEVVLAALFGLLIGSFLNVCIYRWPRDLSVVKPRSHCIRCDTTIAWYDNVPVISFVVLGGRCRHCGAAISLRYPIVELLTGALFAGCVLMWGPTAAAAKYCVFSALMIGLLFADLEMRLLPDEMTLGGLAAGQVFSLFVPMREMMWPWTPQTPWGSLAAAAAGAVIPAGLLWSSGWIFEKVRHKEGLGFGDVKLMALVGSFLGFGGSVLTMLVGSVAGSVIGLLYIWITRKDPGEYQLPFGTFLGAAAIVVAFAGKVFLEWWWAR